MRDDVMFWLRHNPVLSALSAGFLISLLVSSGNILNNFRKGDLLKAVVDENSLKEQITLAAADHEKSQAKIAESRYLNGCLPVFTGQTVNTFSSLTEGLPVVDRNRRKPLPDGVVVCDANGSTGQIIHGVVGAVAYTGNPASINRIKQHFTARYYVPTLKD